jgi:SAM-dependent methyltransferase
MHDRLTSEELAALPEKAKRDPAVVDLYRENDYLTAYALHTDRRVLKEGHEPAAGADASRDNWDRHGELQRDFLIHAGLKPEHWLLDLGCGAGRLARKIVPYLEIGHYHGVDISAASLEAAHKLARTEGWLERAPLFWIDHVPPVAESYDFIWAHSVVPHLPPPLIAELMVEAARLLKLGGVFYWTYVPSKTTARYGLTQFRTALDVYQACTAQAGLTFAEVPDWVRAAGYVPGRWSYGQSLAVSRHV